MVLTMLPTGEYHLLTSPHNEPTCVVKKRSTNGIPLPPPLLIHSMATAVNSKTLTMTQAMAVATVFEIIGAMTLGSYK